ncbi:MAG: dTMP kinase [Ilumatobacteraceae bacterium]
MAPPAYIALEGPEGCGKSTQSRLLATTLGAVVTRETGGTPVGQRLREILHDIAVTDLDARAEALMTAADRAQHMATVVRPALEAGRHVVSDRSVYSTLAYQGYGRELPLDDVRRINDWALRGTWPSLVVLLEVPATAIARRMHSRQLDRFELEDPAFHQRVVTGFREMADHDPGRWVVVDATRPTEHVAADIARLVADRLGIRAAAR